MLQVNSQLSANLGGRRERYHIKKKHEKPYMPKKAMNSETQGRREKRT